MFTKGFYFLAWFAILSGMFLVFLVTFWLIYPYNPLTIKHPIQVITKEVSAGDELIYSIEYCKNVNIPSTLTKEYIDGVIYAAPPIVANNPKGCGINLGMITVPNLPAGNYKIRFTYTYKMNPLREISVVVESSELVVVEAQ